MSGELVGRQSEILRLGEVLRTASHRPQVLFVSGEPGIGKSALLDHAEEMARDFGHVVLRCTGTPAASVIAYAGLNALLLPIAARLDRLRPPLAAALKVAVGLNVGSEPAELVIVNALSAVLEQVSERTPVTILIDDVQWLDRKSATTVELLVRRLKDQHVAVIAAQRSGDASFFSAIGLPELMVGPLTDDASDALLVRRFPRMRRERRRALLDLARGNPLALTVFPAGVGEPTITPADWPALPLKRRLAETFESQLARLSLDARSALLLLALDTTGGVAGLQSVGDLARLESAEHAGVVRIDPANRQAVFAHPLVRLAVVEMSTARQRQAAHHALAEVSTTDPVRQAWHLASGTIAPDESVARQLEETARTFLRRTDPASAVTLLTRSAELSPVRHDRARRLNEAAGIAADVVGRLDTASALVVQAKMLATDKGGSLGSALTAARLLVNADSDITTTARLLSNAIETNLEDEEFNAANDELVEALHLLGVLAWSTGSDEAWAPYLRFSTRLASQLPALLDVSEQLLRDPVENAAAALPKLDALIADLARVSDPLNVVRVAKAGVYFDRIADCRGALQRVVDDGRVGGAVASAFSAMTSLSVDSWFAGRWHEVMEYGSELQSMSQDHGYRRYDWIVVGYLGALVAGAREGSVDPEAARALEWARARGAGVATQFLHHVNCLAALGTSDFSRAYTEASEAVNAGELPAGNPHIIWWTMDFVEAAHRSGHNDAAREHVRAISAAGIAELSPRLQLEILAAQALVADNDARELFEAALNVVGAKAFPFHYARVQLLYGEHLRRQAALSHSRLTLDSALSLFVELGASPWADRARAEIRATGTRRRSPRADASGQADALTPQEREISELAAAGLSNKDIAERLYLSHRTVGVHLHRAFPKLGVTSRAGLRDALSRLAD